MPQISSEKFMYVIVYGWIFYGLYYIYMYVYTQYFQLRGGHPFARASRYIEKGGLLRYFSRASGSGADLWGRSPVHTISFLGVIAFPWHAPKIGGFPQKSPKSSADSFFVLFFVAFPWLFRGPHFGQILHALALEKSSEKV